ncbi:MAG: D-2-hydroxyacid dehydrogenase, partial [Verrucomicrobiota bacterium]
VAQEVEIAVGGVPHDYLSACPNLVWYQQFGSGVDWLRDHPKAIAHPFVLTNCSDNHCHVLADHAFALILSFSREIPRFSQLQTKGRWDRPLDYTSGRFELRGKTMLVVGLGSIGLEIVKRARAFGLRLIGLRGNPEKAVRDVENIFCSSELDTAVSEADLIVNTLPHTKETHHLFDNSAFAAAKKGAYFFNVGRGGTVDEAALINALSNGQLAGAGLDVFEVEPLPESSPLWQMKNVLITPHTGGSHDRLHDNWFEVIFDNLERRRQNRELRNVVDKSKGY